MDNLNKLRQLAGIKDINYELAWLEENSTLIDDRRNEFEVNENHVGPFLLENGDIKIFDSMSNAVIEAQKINVEEVKKQKKNEVLDKPIDKELKKDKLEHDKSVQDSDKHEFPKEIQASIEKRIKETEESLKDYKLKNTQYIPNDGNILPNVIDELNKIRIELDKKTTAGFTQAQLQFQKLSSPITNLFPPNLVTFLAKNNGS